MNSVISFTAAPLYTIFSKVTIIQYPWADVQFSPGRCLFCTCYCTKKKKCVVSLQRKEACTWVKNVINYILLSRIFRKDSAS